MIRSFLWRIEGTVLTVMLLLFSEVAGLLVAEQQPATAGRSESQTKERKSDQAGEHTFDDLLNRDPGAIANEKRYFVRVQDPKLKQRAASILLSLGVRDRIYFDYLVAAAKKAFADETPWPTLYDEDGNMNTRATHPVFAEWIRKQGLDPNDLQFTAVREYNPAFLEWCKKKNLEPNHAQYEAYYVTPEPWYNLAAAGDPRAYDLLIQGLHSHNLMIVVDAANGLAKLQDSRAIPELITMGRQLPGEARYGIGESLLYFSDTKAQASADEFITSINKEMLEPLRQYIKEKGFKLLFQW
jgi:hypothetical protein